MNLAPGHGYTVIHYSGPLGCLLSVVQFPKADSMATAKEANIAARLCFCDEQSMVCPAPLKPNCDGGVLTCVQ
jgi:hypothetical protein